MLCGACFGAHPAVGPQLAKDPIFTPYLYMPVTTQLVSERQLAGGAVDVHSICPAVTAQLPPHPRSSMACCVDVHASA
jgi:hypothetical protein